MSYILSKQFSNLVNKFKYLNLLIPKNTNIGTKYLKNIELVIIKT